MVFIFNRQNFSLLANFKKRATELGMCDTAEGFIRDAKKVIQTNSALKEQKKSLVAYNKHLSEVRVYLSSIIIFSYLLL